MVSKKQLALISLIIALAAASRLVKHPFNFTPIIAMSIFGGCYLKKYWGALIPLAAMFFSDLALYQFKYGWSFFDWKTLAAVYFSIAIAYMAGRILTNHKKWYFVIGAGAASSLIFFFITNFSVWAFFDWYPHTWAGLLNCFTLALPFFRNSLAGDIIYTGGFFALYEFVAYAYARKSMKPASF